MKRSRKRKLRVVIDTNVLISGSINEHGYSHQLILLWREKAFALIVTKQLKAEYQSVLKRPKFSEKYGLSKEEISAIIRRINKGSLLVMSQKVLPITVRDKKDEKIIGAAFGGKADYIVTGDKDLLVLNKSPRLGKLKIVTVKEVLEVLS